MLQRLVLPLLLLLSLTWASPRYDIKTTSRSRLTTRDALHKKFLRIMPLGDSITFGYLSSDGNGYREHLFSQLVAERNDVDMVGSVQAGTMADNFNEGHPGWVITQIADAAAASTGSKPNVVLLHAGTNDMNIPTDPTKAYERPGTLIDQLNDGWPAAAILVAKIIPAANSSTMKNINAYNAQISGLRVFATARKADSIADLTALGIETLSLEVDKAESIKVVVQDIQHRTGGGLDILVNNAGRNYTVPALDIDFDEVQQTFEVNVFAVMRMCREFAPLLIEAKGTIVQIGSLAGIMPYVFGSVYNASKAALHAYSNTLRVELAPFGVKVVTIVTGGVKSRIARTERTLPEGSLYVPIDEEYQRRTKHSQEGAMPNETYARSVASQVLKSSPPKWVWEGNKAWLVWFIDAFLPKGFMDLVFTKMFNLWKLTDYTSMKKKI